MSLHLSVSDAANVFLKNILISFRVSNGRFLVEYGRGSSLPYIRCSIASRSCPGFQNAGCNLFEIKSELQTFYDKIRDVTPGALQLLLVGPPIIEYEFLLSHFDFMAYEKVDTSSFGENDVIKSDFSPVEKDLFDRSVSYIKQILKDWCGELPDQTHLRRFLQYLFGVPTISPLFQSKWRFYIDFSLHHCSMLMAWSCENTIRTPIFRTFESCLEAFQSTITGFEADPKSRDMAHTSNQND